MPQVLLYLKANIVCSCHNQINACVGSVTILAEGNGCICLTCVSIELLNLKQGESSDTPYALEERPRYRQRITIN